MNVSRLVDPVQCKICGIEGPTAASANCPRCRTAYHDHAPAIYSTYENSPQNVLAAVAEVLATHPVAVVRKISGQRGLYHVGGLRNAQQVDGIAGTMVTHPHLGNVLYLSFADLNHRLVNINDLRPLLGT